MPLPRLQPPRLTTSSFLLAMLAVLMVGSMFYARESLLFCEKALYGEVKTIEREATADKPVKFTDVCPEMRQRTENMLNEWLKIILALLVQFPPHNSP